MDGAPRRAAALAAAALVAVSLVAAVAPAGRSGNGGDNAAVAINTTNGTATFSVHLNITRESGDVVDASNVAVAYASCTDCAAVAIAFQAVLATGDPSVIEPTNIAIADNTGCTNCTTVADAYQQVLLTDGANVHFTPEGRQEFAQIRHQLHDLRKSDLSLADLVAQLDALQADFADVLAHDVVVSGRSGTI